MKFIRLIEVLSLQELTMIKLAFNKENVGYKILFENSLQVGNVSALGNRGAIIEVAETHYKRAATILSELGIEVASDPSKDRFKFVNAVDNYTRNIPLVGKWDLEIRFLFVLGLLIVVILSMVFYIILRKSPG